MWTQPPKSATSTRRPGLGAVVLTLAWASAWHIAGCCGSEEAEGAAGGEAGPETADGAAPEPEPPEEVDEATPLGQAALSLRPHLKGASWREPIEGVLSHWKGKRQPMTDLLRETYRQRDYRPVFLDGLWPSEAAAVVIAALSEVPSHGLPHSPYRPKALVPLFESLALAPEAGPETLTEPIGDNERLAKLEWQLPRSVYKRPRKSERVPEVRYRPLRDLPELERPEPGVRCLLEVLHEAAARRGRDHDERAAACLSKAGALEPGLAKAQAQIESRRGEVESLALLDAMLLQAYYQWVLDFTIDARVHPFESQGPINRSRLPREHRDELLEALGDLDDAEAFTARMRGFVPSAPEYDHTRRALNQYVELMDETEEEQELRAGGWLKQGIEGEAVEALQRRLTAEQYYSGPISGELDQATHDAVVQYQRTHGLANGGVVGAETVENLNIPFEWRVKQLLVALGRWRESPISRRPEPDLYIRINIPAFELRVMEQGEEVRRHKVIVGSRHRVEDPVNDVTWHARRTKIFDTVLNEVVINPNWIVPKTIVVDEIQPKIQASESYLEENNFNKVGDLLVQGPAPTNPLGVLKFTLESTDAIYLHDTDKRWLFDEVDRDLSHGCIRVDEPVDLAHFILKRQGVERARIEKRIEEGTTVPVKLESPIPVFVEYNTVEFTAEGEPIFHTDVYHYDVAYWKKRTPITRRFP